MTNFNKFHEIFSRFGGSAHRTPIIACPYYIPYIFHSSALTFKSCRKYSHLSRIFSLFFKILLILMFMFDKLPQTWGLCPIVEFRSDPRKLDPLNRKILHELLGCIISLLQCKGFLTGSWSNTYFVFPTASNYFNY